MSDAFAQPQPPAFLVALEVAAEQPTNSPHLALDVEAERAVIRTSLTFRHEPLEGKGQPQVLGLADWADRPFRQIVEELLVAYWEIAANLDQRTVAGDIARLRNFLRFVEDEYSPYSRRHSPETLKDISFQTLRDFEHWLGERQDNTRYSLLETRKAALITIVVTQPLPRHKLAIEPIVSLRGLCSAIQAPATYISKHATLWAIVAEAAQRQGLRMPKLRAQQAAPSSRSVSDPRPPSAKRLATKSVEEIYYTLNKILRHIERHRRYLLADDFVLATLNEPERVRSRVKSAALTPTEFHAVEAACLAAIRRVKTRLLAEGPARAARGRANLLSGESEAAWGESLDNLIAYLATYAPCLVVGRGRHRQKHRRFVNALRARREETGHEIARWLSPDLSDLCPFLIRMACSEHAPLNLASLLALHVEPDAPRRHCVRPSPTPGHKRIFFGKPRAGIDQIFVDVPSRSALDLPGLINSIIELTQSLRAHAPHHLRHELWLYLSHSRGIRAWAPAIVADTLRKFVARESIRGDDGELLRGLHYRRFRPTIIASIALDDGIESAQRRAAHANPMQTLAYVNNPGSEERVRGTVSTAQSKAIAAIRAGFEQRPSPQEVNALARELGITLGATAEIIAGQRDKLFNSCIDDRNGRGPELAGRQCGRFEACLVCVNSIILERHLPRLITYYNYWLRMAEEMDDVSWRDAHELNCAIVESHLQKFEPAVVDRVTAEVLARPLVIGYRKFKQS